jgi:hypothetical protein
MTIGPAGTVNTNVPPQNYGGVSQEQVEDFKEAVSQPTTSSNVSGMQSSKDEHTSEHSQDTSKSLPFVLATRPPINLGSPTAKQGAPLYDTQGKGSKAGSETGASPAATGARTADAPARDPTLSQAATGLKPGEPISAKVTTKEDITNPKAEMTFDFSKQITKDQAAAILFQGGKVPGGATLTQGKGNQWTVEYRNKQDVVSHMNSHTESVLTRNKLPGEMFHPKPDTTFSWVGGAKAFNTTTEGPPRRDLKNDMGFVVSKRYPLDEGQSSHMNVRRLVEPGPGYEVVFDKPKTRDQVKDTFFEKGVRDDTLAHASTGGIEPAQGSRCD